jgi:hypothetical protein
MISNLEFAMFPRRCYTSVRLSRKGTGKPRRGLRLTMSQRLDRDIWTVNRQREVTLTENGRSLFSSLSLRPNGDQYDE